LRSVLDGAHLDPVAEFVFVELVFDLEGYGVADGSAVFDKVFDLVGSVDGEVEGFGFNSGVVDLPFALGLFAGFGVSGSVFGLGKPDGVGDLGTVEWGVAVRKGRGSVVDDADGEVEAVVGKVDGCDVAGVDAARDNRDGFVVAFEVEGRDGRDVAAFGGFGSGGVGCFEFFDVGSKAGKVGSEGGVGFSHCFGPFLGCFWLLWLLWLLWLWCSTALVEGKCWGHGLGGGCKLL